MKDYTDGSFVMLLTTEDSTNLLLITLGKVLIKLEERITKLEHQFTDKIQEDKR